MSKIINITKLRETLKDSGNENLLRLFDIMSTEANDQLIKYTDSEPEIKGKPDLQNLLVTDYIATFLSGMIVMSRIPNHFKLDALQDIKTIADALEMKLKKAS